MDILNLSQIHKQPISKRILARISDLPDEEVDKDALEIILYAIEHGIRCKKTANYIASIIEGSIEINRDMFHIIQGLAIGDYVYLPPEISGKIETYLDKMGNRFYSPEDLELHVDLIEDPTIIFPKESHDESTY